jgi:hypothetical protein
VSRVVSATESAVIACPSSVLVDPTNETEEAVNEDRPDLLGFVAAIAKTELCLWLRIGYNHNNKP